MSRVIVLGSSNTDLTVRAGRLPTAGETVMGSDFQVSFGGKGANQALAALHCGLDVQFVTKIGTDGFGQDLADHLQRSGLSPKGIRRDSEHPSGVALIVVGPGGDNQIVVAPGSNNHLSPADVDACADLFTPGAILLAQLEIPLSTVAHGLKLAKSRQMTTILNPAPYSRLSPQMLAATDILTPNRSEAAALAGSDPGSLNDIRTELSTLVSQGPQQVILTLGEDGAMIISREHETHIPAFPVQAVDCVGAGDAFNGVLAAALAREKALPEAVRLASAAAALSTTTFGAQAGLPERIAIEALAGITFN